MRQLVFLISFVFISLFVNVQAKNTSVELFHREDGLPNDLIKSFAKDSLGFIWVATDDGLVKIEGRQFITVSTPKMFSNNFKNILVSKKFGLITSSDPGVLKVKQSFDNIQSAYLGDELNINNFPEFIYPKTLYEDSDSALWIADLKNVYKITDKEAVTYTFSSKNFTDHFSRSYHFFELDSNNFFTFSQTGFLHQYNSVNDSFVEVPWDFEGTPIYSVEKINDSSFLIGCEFGLLIFEFNKHGILNNILNLDFNYVVSTTERVSENEFIIGTWNNGAFTLDVNDNKNVFSHMFNSGSHGINDIIIDNQNQIWLGTNMGIILYRETVFEEPFNHVTQNFTQSVKVIKDKVYFSDGNTVYEVDKDGGIILFYTSKEGMVISLAVDDNGLLMGTNTGLLISKKFNGVISVLDLSNEGNGIYNLEIDRELNVWIIQSREDKETLLRIDKAGNIVDLTPDNDGGGGVYSLIVSPKGNLFVGGIGNSHYLFKYNYSTKKIENLSIPIQTQFDIPLAVIDMEFIDERAYLLATRFGLWKYSENNIEQLGIGDMTNEMVSAIVLDNRKQIWFANSNGVVKYNNGKTTYFDNDDGLPAKTIHNKCLAIDSLGNIWGGTVSGIAKGKIRYYLEKTHKPIISSLLNSGISIDIENKNRFVQNSILSLTVATPIYPAKYIKYQYSLSAEKNDNWIDLSGFSDNILISNLERGNYTIKIRARNKGNYDWSEPVLYKFKIYKIWYLRIEVLSLIYLGVFFIIWFYIRNSKAKSEREKIKLHEIIDSRTRDLQDQNEELKKLNSNLKLAKNEAEAAIKTKDRFFSIVAHDLKSPFNSLIGFSQLLVNNRKEFSDEALDKIFVEILKVSENSYKFLENLLEWAMSQTGRMQVERIDIDFAKLISDIILTLESAANNKRIKINIDLDKNLSVYADELMIGTIFRNLISNSIKFSNSDSVISINGKVVNGYAEISVQDQGVGISEEDIEKLFQIDSSISTLGTADEKGTGLGLLLCDEFVKKNGGFIEVQSKINMGTTFTVKLPIS